MQIVYLGPHREAFEQDTRFYQGTPVEIEDFGVALKILAVDGFVELRKGDALIDAPVVGKTLILPKHNPKNRRLFTKG